MHLSDFKDSATTYVIIAKCLTRKSKAGVISNFASENVENSP
jgi:hypothetical protein